MDGVTYVFEFDYENLLAAVRQSEMVAGSFLYDGDGNRVKTVMNGETITFVGNLYEKKVMGSTATGANGELVASAVYEAWEEITPVFGDLPTARRYTGQLQDPPIAGIYYYGARYYDPALGRFLQADTIVPSPENPQSLNRYSYVLNNSLRFSDPTGHRVCEDVDCRITRRPPRGSRFPDRDLTPFAVAQARMMTDDVTVLVINAYNHSGNLAAKAAAYWMFEGLVGDGKRWDLKDKMLQELGDSSMLCSTSTCYWFEYSVLGNILYGYVGTQAGFTEPELGLGAGYAEARDPENKERRNWPANYPIAYMPEERRDYYYDDPYDYAAVGMGIAMSQRYRGNVTLQAFQALVADYHEELAPGTPNYDPVAGPGGPYQAGRFDQSNELLP